MRKEKQALVNRKNVKQHILHVLLIHHNKFGQNILINE